MWDSIALTGRRWRGWWLDTPAGSGQRWVALASKLSTAAGHQVVPPLLVLAGAVAQLSTPHRSVKTPLAAGIVLSIGLACPLLLRRRWPATVFTAIATVALVQWACDIRLVADLALLVALYTVFERRAARANWLAAAVLELGIGLAVLRWESAGRADTFVLLSAAALAAATTGVAVRNRRLAHQSMIERAGQEMLAQHQRTMLEISAGRTRIAREMHDIVAHGLAVMVTLAEAAAAKLPTKPDEAVTAIRTISTVGRSELADLRRMLRLLRLDNDAVPERGPQPGLAELAELLDRVRATGLEVAASGFDGLALADPGAQLVLYRVVQEALTNVLKHARQPTTVTIHVQRTEFIVRVDVADNGRPQARDRTGGLGLLGLQERIAAYGGRLTAGPGDDGGWRLHATIEVGTEQP